MIKISSYTTVRCPILMNYPVEQSIRSLFPFSSEVVVCDTSDQDDGTTELLEALKQEFETQHGAETFKIVRNHECDYTKPNFGIYDGQNKAYARSYCTGDYCVQIDADEVFEDSPNIKEKILNLIYKLDKDNPVISSLVLEPWGSNGKLRLDINSWKERISINDPNITHGIPASHRKYINGLLYSHPGSDGCVTPGTKIMTIEGEKDIENIKVGDLILTHKGRFKKVTHFFVREDKMWDLYKIKSRNYLGDDLNITDNHPILMSKLKYNGRYKEKNISWCSIQEPNWVELKTELPNKNNCFIYPKLSNEYNNPPKYYYNNKEIKPNKELGFIIGMFLGDGSIVHRSDNKNKNKRIKCVSFALNIKEKKIAERLSKAIKSQFGIEKIQTTEYSKKNWINVTIHKKSFAEFIKNICGNEAKNKLLDSTFYHWDKDSILGILEGLYYSDGADTPSGMVVSMINGTLLSQIKLLLTKADIFSSLLSYKKKPTIFQKNSITMYQLRITGKQIEKLSFLFKKPNHNLFHETEKYFHVRNSKSVNIQKIQFKGKLYNLEIEEDNSYVANGITVHNCNMLDKRTGQPIPCLNFITQQSEDIRRKAITDLQYVSVYENWVTKITNKLPVIHHYSWFSVYQKMIKYKLFWNKSWQALYFEQKPEGWNPFFNKSLEQVTDEEMIATARQIESETAGHVFHSAYQSGVSLKTNGMCINIPQPKSMIDWCANNKTP